MSIRYTIRHNIPSASIAEEDVNDSSTWDLNLLRKHELAETDNHDIVYRQHDGKVVNWADAATQQANEILEEVQGISADIDNQVTMVENKLAEIEEEAVTLTQEAQEANEAAQTALVQAELAVSESQQSATSAKDSANLSMQWAVKEDGLVGNQDYSSKYYAQQAGTSANSASSSASTATIAKNDAQTSATNASDSATLAQQWATKTDGKVDSTDYSAKHYALSCVDSATSASQSATDAATSASTATTKASQASASASTATTKANEASAFATSASNSASTATTKASEASASASNASQSATRASASATNASASEISASTSASDAEIAKDEAEEIAEEIRNIKNFYGLPIGYEYFSINPNVPQGSLPLLGGEYSRATYSDLWAWVQQQAGYCKTEAEWQTLYTLNNGNVPYYSDGDGSTTFRVPSLKCWVKGANGTVTEVGSYLEAGLPNITGGFDTRTTNYHNGAMHYNYSGALYQGTTSGASDAVTQYNGSQPRTKTEFDASRSSAIYGNSNTVQPESIVGLWLVKAYGTIVDTGTIDEQQYIDDRIAALPNTFLPRTGGTMSGVIRNNWNYGAIIKNSDPNSSGGIAINGGYEDANGGQIVLVGEGNPNNPGNVVIRPRNSNGFKELIAYPNGTLTWDGKNVERVNASGSNYIRFESGIQICWGNSQDITSSGTFTINFPVAFGTTTHLIVTIGRWWVSSSTENYYLKDTTTTSIKLTTIGSVVGGGHQYHYTAIGYWK